MEAVIHTLLTSELYLKRPAIAAHSRSMQDLKRTLNEHFQRYSREFRRRNPEVKEQVAGVRVAVSDAEQIDAGFVRDKQLVHILLHGCYTKQVPIVSASVQAFHFLVESHLLVDADLQLVVQVLFELTDSGLSLAEIGSTALACCLSRNSPAGLSLAKAISVCLRQRCPLWDLHRVVAAVIDRSAASPEKRLTLLDELSTTSFSAVAPPPVHAMDQVLTDAFGLLQDLVSLAGRRQKLHWLHRVRHVPLVVTLDVLAYTLTRQPTLFLQNHYFEKLLQKRVLTLVSACLDNVVAGRGNIVEEAEEAMSHLDSSDESDDDSGAETPTEEEEGEEPMDSDELFLRLVVISEHLIRNFASMDRLRRECSSLLEQLLRSLPTAPRNKKAMMLKSWSNLLSACFSSWPDRAAVEAVLFPRYLVEVATWLCKELGDCVNDSRPVDAPPEEGVVAFCKNTVEIRIREVGMTTEIAWTSCRQNTVFDAPQYLYIVLLSTKSLLISLNTHVGEAGSDGASQGLRQLITTACKATTNVVSEMVRHCVNRRTDQSLILTMETTLELAGRAGLKEVCEAIVLIHTTLIHRCLTRLQAMATIQPGEFPPRESVSDISHRVAQFGIGLLHLASTYSVYILDTWPAIVDVVFRLMTLFDFPYFKDLVHFDFHPQSLGRVVTCGSTMASMVSLVCEEVTDVRGDLEFEIGDFFSKSPCYPHEVLRRQLHAFFSNMTDRAGQARDSVDSKEEFECLMHFTIAKVSELAVYNMERFHTFGEEWLNDFVGLFFCTVQSDVKPARQSFFAIVNRLVTELDKGFGREEHDRVVEKSLVGALHHFELVSRAELMQLQIACLNRLADRYATRLPTNCYPKTLVAIPQLLRRHNTLKDRKNIEAAFGVFKDFVRSPALGDPEVRRQCCERNLDLAVSFLTQRLCLDTATATPATLRHIYCLIRTSELDLRPDFEHLLLQHVRQLEAFCRDSRADVRRGVTNLLFDVLREEELHSSDCLFSQLVASVVSPGLEAIVKDLGRSEPQQDAVEMYSNYIVNVTNIAMVRYAETKTRSALISTELWRTLLEHLRAAMRLSIDPIAYAVLFTLQRLTQGAAKACLVDEQLRAFRRMVWCQAVELAWCAVRGEVAESLLPDAVLLLEENFALQFVSLDARDIKEVCDILSNLVLDRAASPNHTEPADCVRKERSLLSLLTTVVQTLLDSGMEENESTACRTLLRLANLPFPSEGQGDVPSTTWPMGHIRPYQRQAFALLTDVASLRLQVNDGQQRQWLQRCLSICEQANRSQYLCIHMGTWHAVYACFSVAIDALLRGRLQLGSREEVQELAEEYDRALEGYLFSREKNSRQISAADFLEHQRMELEVLGKMQTFIADQSSREEQQILRNHLTRSFIRHLTLVARTPATDVLLDVSCTGPSMAEEFCDSRQWRFQAACIQALVFLMNWWLEQPASRKCDDDLDVLHIFKEYVLAAFVSFRERLEARGGEPLPSVTYLEVSCILDTVKAMLASAPLDEGRRRCVVELYPLLVDVILYCSDRMLAHILEVLHAYKPIMLDSKA